MKIEIFINDKLWMEAELRDDVGIKVAGRLGNVLHNLFVDHEYLNGRVISFSRHPVHPNPKTKGILTTKSRTINILYNWLKRILDEVKEPIYNMNTY